jgi:hypothetical protein
MFGFKVICWALLFIFKLRFPPGVSIAKVWYSHDITRMSQGWRHKVVTILLNHDYNGLVGTTKSNSIDNINKVVDNLGQAVRTQLIDGLSADLLQDVRFLRVYESQLVRNSYYFYTLD